MPPNGPDISVRLSAAGVQDVINALKRVRQEGKDTGSVLGSIGNDLKSFIPAVSISAGIGLLAKLSLSARENEEAIGKMGEKTGASVERLSVLALVAHDSEVELDALSAGLVKLAKAQVAAADGSAKEKKVFSDLGVSIKDLRTLDPAAIFVKVSAGLDKLPAGAQKTAASLVLFGKAGAQLIPMLDALGTNGFDTAYEKAKRLGLLLDDDMVASARSAQDAIHELEDIAEGLGRQFNKGFMADATHAVEDFAETVSGSGVNGAEKLGEIAGRVLIGVVNLARGVSTVIAGVLQSLLQGFLGGVEVIENTIDVLADKGFGAAGKALKTGISNQAEMQGSIWGTVGGDLKSFWNDTVDPKLTKPVPRPKTAGGGATGNGTSAEDAAKAAKAYTDLLQARADNELAIQKALTSSEEAADKRKYDAGLMSLDEYYDAREKRINDAAAAEQSIIDDKILATSRLPEQNEEQRLKKQQEFEKLSAQSSQVLIKQQADLAAAEDERSKARHDANLRELQEQQQLANMAGDKSKAQQLALQVEIQQYTELLQKQGKSADEIARATDEYKRRAEAKINFGDTAETGSIGLSSLGRDVQSIQAQAGAGVISQAQATARIIELEKQRLEGLKEIGLQLTLDAELSGDPQLIEQARQYNAQLDQMELGLKNVTTAGVEFSNQMMNSLGSFSDTLAGALDGTSSWSDTFDSIAKDFESMITKMISRLLVFYALEAILGWVAPNASFTKALTAKGPFGFASGGYTGDGNPNEVAGVVHKGEWVFPADVTAKNKGLFAAIQAGGSIPAIATPAGYAAGSGEQATANSVDASSMAPVINITTPAGTQAQTSQRTGSNGQSVTDIVITALVDDIGRNGRAAKTMQSTFGLTRQGTRRQG